MSNLLALWAIPRSRSTAFLRMMVARGDCTVVHEPFSHVNDFGQVDVGGQICQTPETVIDRLLDLSAHGRVFFKDTSDFPYHAVITSERFLRNVTHTFLIGDPQLAIASHLRMDADAPMESMGYGHLLSLYQAVVSATGHRPVVMDGDLVSQSPHAQLSTYFSAVQWDFRADALTWPSGDLDLYGASKDWHQDVSASSGFLTQQHNDNSVDTEQLALFVRAHGSAYRILRDHVVTVRGVAQT